MRISFIFQGAIMFKRTYLPAHAILVIIIFISNNTYALVPQLIRNTTLVENAPSKSQLPKWLKYCIPIGMTCIETHIAENYARYAPEITATSKLLRELFNIKTEDFRIPDPQVDRAGNYISPKIMGKIIRLIFESTQAGGKILSNRLNCIKPEIKKTFKKTRHKLDKQYSRTGFRSSFKKFVESLVGSLEECNYWGNNKTPIYAPPYHAVSSR